MKREIIFRCYDSKRKNMYPVKNFLTDDEEQNWCYVWGYDIIEQTKTK